MNDLSHGIIAILFRENAPMTPTSIHKRIGAQDITRDEVSAALAALKVNQHVWEITGAYGLRPEVRRAIVEAGK